MKTYTVDKHGVKHAVDWHDFINNDENPTLNRLAEELLQDHKFHAILKANGYQEETE